MAVANANADPGNDPPFYIRLAQPNRGYRPGEVICGHVVSQNDYMVAHRRSVVHITLEGRSKSKIKSHEKYSGGIFRARVPLVYQTHELGSKERAERPPSKLQVPNESRQAPSLSRPESSGRKASPRIGTTQPIVNRSSRAYSAPASRQISARGTPRQSFSSELIHFPFEIEIPTKTQDLRESSPFTDEYWSHDLQGNSKYFKAESIHDVPPTLTEGPRGAYLRSEGYVEYKLIAAESWIKHDFGPDGQDAVKLEPFKFAQCGLWMVNALPPYYDLSSRLVPWSHVDFKTYRLDPAIGTGKPSFKQRTKMTIRSSAVPAIKLRIEPSIPEVLIVGRPFDVRVSLGPPTQDRQSWKDQAWTRAHPGALSVEGISVRVKRYLRVRTDFKMDRRSDTILDQAFSAIDGSLPPAAISRAAGGFPSAQVECGPLPPQLAPTSLTINLTHHYEVRVSARVCCYDESQTITQTFLPIVGFRPKRESTSRTTPVFTDPFASTNASSGGQEKDDLEDLGPYELDPDEMSVSVRSTTHLLKGLSFRA